MSTRSEIDPEDFQKAHEQFYDFKKRYKDMHYRVRDVVFVSSKTRHTYVANEDHTSGQFTLHRVNPGEAYVDMC